MTDIRTVLGNTKFDVRACGMLKNKQGELLVSTEVDGTQTLSGGAVKIGETTEEALVREFLEETNLHVTVEKLVAIVENFFEFEGGPYQQLIFIYELSLTEEGQALYCREKVNVNWEPLQEVRQLKPVILNEIIQLEGDSIRHFINQDYDVKGVVEK